MKITFVWHDCFVAETADACFIFDYWLDTDGKPSEFPAFLNSLPREKPLFVLVSHAHKDHFNTDIFGWAELFSDIHFILSRDVARRVRHIMSPTSVYNGPKIEPSLVSVLRPGETFVSDGIRITAFPSTDTGNSYLAESSNLSIFHAGDLNAWITDEADDTPANRKMMGDFNACLRDIEAYLDSDAGVGSATERKIDVCFFPVDSRIGKEYFTGARIFVRKFNVGHFFPMHFDLGDADERNRRKKDAIDFNRYANFNRGQYIPLVTNGSYWLSADS